MVQQDGVYLLHKIGDTLTVMAYASPMEVMEKPLGASRRVHKRSATAVLEFSAALNKVLSTIPVRQPQPEGKEET